MQPHFVGFGEGAFFVRPMFSRYAPSFPKTISALIWSPGDNLSSTAASLTGYAMVIAAMKPGISSPSILTDWAGLSMDTTRPVNWYRFTLALSPLAPVGWALCDGPQAARMTKQPETSKRKIVVRVRCRISNEWLTVFPQCRREAGEDA